MRVMQIGCNAVYPADYLAERPNGLPGYLLLATRSACTVSFGGAQQSAPPGSIILFDKNKPHSYAAEEDCLRCDWVQFDTDFDEDFFRALNLPLGSVRSYGDMVFLQELLKNLCAAYYNPGPKRHELMDALLKTLLLKTGELVSLSAPTGGDPHFTELAAIRERIYQNPQEKWTVELLAGLANMSRSYFHLRYREAFGVTAISDVINCKMSCAKELLTSTDYTIGHVAALCGYDNEEHFMRLFKKNCGATPTVYRRENKAKLH